MRREPKPKRRSAIARDLRSPKYKQRVVPDRKKAAARARYQALFDELARDLQRRLAEVDDE